MTASSLCLLVLRRGWTPTFRRARLLPASPVVIQRCLESTEATQRVPAGRMPHRVKLTAGKRYSWCACGHSKKQPFCDGAHRSKAPSISPLRFTPDKDSMSMLCACKHTKNPPYCDGSHFKLIFQDLVKSMKRVFK